eukprot:gene8355-3434_t
MAMGLRAQQAFVTDRRAFKAATVRPANLCTRVVSARTSGAQPSVICQAAVAEAPAVFKGDLLNKTYYPTSADVDASRKQWYIVDASGQTLGRLACLVATYVRGKNMATYHPAMDMGSYVVVINAEKVVVSGKKADDKIYFNHVTGRPGSYRKETFKHLQARLPERIIERAVKGMLPKGTLGRKIKLHCKVFKGPNHDHTAQQPIDITKEINGKVRDSAGAKQFAEIKAAAVAAAAN